ncbi:MAG: hypothetical protein V3S01_04125, partial [Dehalococcoidia bacterium]
LLAGTHGRGLFSLTLDRPLTLAVVPGPRADSVRNGSTTLLTDSATVVLSGANAAVTEWTATNTGAPWLTLSTTGGTGTSRLRWSRDPTGLGEGVFIDTIRVTAPGAIDSPFEVVNTLEVLAPLFMSVEPTSRSDTAIVGSISLDLDSASVTLSGPASDQAPWEATHGSAPWITVTTPNVLGSGFVQWTRNPAGLAEGTYVDTIFVSATGVPGAPAAIIDSLVMIQPLLGLDPTAGSGSAVSGTLLPIPDSALVLLAGAGADTATWNSTASGAPWLTLTTEGGTGSGILRWYRDPRALRDGIHIATITVESSTGGLASFTDQLTLTAPPVPIQCAASHLLGSACLSNLQLRYLDVAGNGDTVYNLGDFLAQIAREGVGEGPGGRP